MRKRKQRDPAVPPLRDGVMLGVRLSLELRAFVDRAAKAQGITASAFIRQILETLQANPNALGDEIPDKMRDLAVKELERIADALRRPAKRQEVKETAAAS